MGNKDKQEKVSCKSELEFVTEVANDCLANMKKKDKEYLIENPYAIDYHFSYCLYIRNHYIHNRDFSEVDFWVEPDYLSSQIIRMIFSLLIPDYTYGDDFTERIFDNRKYINIRKEYNKLYGFYPDYLLNQYRDLIDFEPVHSISEWHSNQEIDLDKELDVIHRNDEKCEVIVEKLLTELAEQVWKTDEFYKLIELKGISKIQINDSVERIKKLFWDKDKIVPLEVCLVKFKGKMDKEKYYEYRKQLGRLINEDPGLMKEMDSDYFNDKTLARAVLKKNGYLLKYMPQYKDDDKIVEIALLDDGEAIQYTSKRIQDSREYVKLAIEHAENGTIMFLDCMKPYRKDKELVYLACDIERWNLVYVDKAFRDDYDLAKLCMQKIGDPNKIYSYLSKRLKENKELVFLDLQEDFPSVEDYPDKIRNDDEVASKLFEYHGLDSWGWYHMSKRLQKKYGYKEK